MTMAPMTRVWTRTDSGTVYHCWFPTFTDGSTTSLNIFSSRGTGVFLPTEPSQNRRLSGGAANYANPV